MPGPRALAAAAALALVCCTGCVSASAPTQSTRSAPPTATAPTPSPSPSPGPAGPRLTGTISVMGGVQLTSTFSAPAAVDVASGTQSPEPAGSTCAQYAMGFDRPAQEGGGKGFDAPEVHSAVVNHQSMYVSVSVGTGYAGPGTYDSRQNGSLRGYAGQDVENPTGVATTPFDSRMHGVTILTVNPDGSGSISMADWGSTEVHGAVGAGGVSISGSITWVCQQ
jgi:hypothetical protein